MRGVMVSLTVVAVFVVLVWAAGQAFGFHVSLWGSLLLSVGLTLLLNGVLRLVLRR